jgi:hypothetical protein
MAAESTQSFVLSGTAFDALLWKYAKTLLELVAENSQELNVHDSSKEQEQEQAIDVE